MKKFVSVLLICILCMGLTVMTGCSKDEPLPNEYSDIDFASYITLPDYDAYTLENPSPEEVTDADVEAEIEKFLTQFAKSENVTEGTVEKGDNLVVSYKGTLADGTTQDGMNTDDASLGPVGSAGYIDGFEEGLIGAAVGETVTLDLQFPDPYQNNPDLAGQDVTFEVTIKSKVVKNMPELTDEFVKENTDYKTADEYRVSVREQLEAEAEENALYNLKNELYAKIYDETEVISYPEGKVEDTLERIQADYEEISQTYGYTNWDDFRNDYFSMDQAEYEENLKLYAESTVKSELMIYAMAEKEGVVLTEKEYEAELQDMLAQAGFADDAAFKEYSGMSIREYADEYRMDRDFILTECLDIVYDRLTK